MVNSARWHVYDYSSPGLYFITICVKDRKCCLGRVKNGIMGLNKLGCICYKYWQELPKHYSDCVLDEFIVMPNHIHFIIEINNNSDNAGRDGACPVSTEQGKTSSLSNIIGSFKSACTREIHLAGHKNFSWQSRFYDHIIRTNAESLDKIRYYIKYNPRMWDKDKNNPINIK